MLDFITWTADPAIFTIGSREIRWYGLAFAIGLGHCLFYAPEYYLANPIEIFKIWEGGLASHGGTLGIIIAIYFYSKRVSHKSMLWAFDKLVVPTGLVAAMIRLGNLMNHEIYGHSTDLPWLYFKKEAWKKQGLIFGVFMICVFGSRFFIEFVKNDQEPFEAGMMLNMGQWLSIPFVLAGCWFVWRALRNGKLKIEN